jgi:hypothetical protein
MALEFVVTEAPTLLTFQAQLNKDIEKITKGKVYYFQ